MCSAVGSGTNTRDSKGTQPRERRLEIIVRSVADLHVPLSKDSAKRKLRSNIQTSKQSHYGNQLELRPGFDINRKVLVSTNQKS